nr:PREDICTED: UDP-glucuronosyltransferase 1-1-like isoform X1 [Bemisia tabaci]
MVKLFKYNKMLKPILLCMAILGSSVNSYKILILYPTTSLSHQLPAMGLAEALLKKGHQVYFAGTDKLSDDGNNNYTFIDFSWLYQYYHEQAKLAPVQLNRKFSKYEFLSFADLMFKVARKFFESDTFYKFYRLTKDEQLHFDAIVIEAIWLPFGVATSRLLSTNGTASAPPVISLSTTAGGDFFGQDDSLGGIIHLSYTPSMLEGYTDRMNLFQRIENWASHHYITGTIRRTVSELAESVFRKNFGLGEEVMADGGWPNASLLISASNPLYFYPRLLPPNIVEVGPLHIKNPEKLPEILQAWLDGAQKGVIYFSLGSNMKSEFLPPKVLSNFLRVFRELPTGYRVLWKCEGNAKIPGQSENILTQKWMPQQSVLAHPQVKVFITQGGCQSFQETVHYGVPIVGIPWFGDQETNVAKMVDAGIGTRIWPQELEYYEKIKSTLEAVLFDTRYAERMKKLSSISRDFTAKAKDNAAFWVEHVARHGGASHLRSVTADTTYIEYFCLDIITLMLTLLFFIIYLVKCSVKYLVSLVLKTSNSKIKSS